MLNSFFAQLLVGLQARIMEKVPEIRWIDQDLGQLEYYEIRPAVSWPCVLIDFPSSTFQEESQQAQIGNVNIEVRLGFPPFSQSSSTAPDSVKEQALKFYELEMKLYQALHGWYLVDQGGAAICQPLVRVSSATEKREDPFRVRSVTFSTAYQDESAMPGYTSPNLPLNIEFL